jgi:hypothetical protein
MAFCTSAVFPVERIPPRGTQVVLVHGGLTKDTSTVALHQLAFFRVVEEIVSMREKPSRVMPGK